MTKLESQITKKYLDDRYLGGGGGGGGVNGPASSTDNAIAAWDGTTGTLLKNTSTTITTAGTINIPAGQKYKINNTDLSYTDVGAAPTAKGVTNGDSHDHNGGDGAQIDHVNLANKGTNTHAQIDSHVASTLNPHSVTYTQVGAAPAGEGVTNGNSHDHSGGDGAQINHTTLSNIGTNTHAQIDSHVASTLNPHSVTYTQVGAAPAGEGVSNGNFHDHNGGDGAQINHTTLSNIGTNTHAQIDTHIANTSNPHNVTLAQVGAAPAAEGVTNGNSHDHSGGDGAQINHTTLSNIGTNTHAQIDTHIANTSNPHSTTASQVGLGSVANKLQVAADGTQALTANWDAGSFQIRAETFYSDVATGTAPMTISSTTVVSNLNADKLDGKDAPTGNIVGTTDTQTLTNKTFTNPANTVQALTDAASISWNMDNGAKATITYTADRTHAAPTNIKTGGEYSLEMTPGAANRTITFNAVFLLPGGATTVDLLANVETVMTFESFDGTNLRCTGITRYS